VHESSCRGAYAFQGMLIICIGACNLLSIYARPERAQAQRPPVKHLTFLQLFWLGRISYVGRTEPLVVLVDDKDFACWRVLASRTQSGWIRAVMVRLLPKQRVRGGFLCEDWGWWNCIGRLDSRCRGCKDSTSNCTRRAAKSWRQET
jgi:hypothetical protein